jgi:hypothetical protein
MLPPIETTARRALMIGSFVVGVAGALVAPLAGSTSGYGSERGRLGTLKSAAIKHDNPWKSAAVMVSRDPFLVEAPLKRALVPALHPANDRGITGMRVIQGQPISAAEMSGASVRAIAFGETSKALVDTDGTARIVAPGDHIDGARIESILPDRVILTGGSILFLSRKLP